MTETVHSEQEAKGRAPHAPSRTCVGCGETGAPAELLKLVRGPLLPEGHVEVAVDLATGNGGHGGASGRGAHVHPNATCIEKAARGGLSRSFRAPVKVTKEELVAQIVAAFDRRITGLLMAAHRTRKLTLGADATLEALRDGAPLALLAKDAGSIAEERSIVAAVAEGRIVRWGDKTTLGALTGRSELAIVAVTSGSISNEIVLARTRSEACSRQEVR